MINVHFYEEFTNKRKRESAGNVTAVFVNAEAIDAYGRPKWDALAALYADPNSAVASIVVGPLYLRLRCRRISEKRAREIHPRLFERLDQ